MMVGVLARASASIALAYTQGVVTKPAPASADAFCLFPLTSQDGAPPVRMAVRLTDNNAVLTRLGHGHLRPVGAEVAVGQLPVMAASVVHLVAPGAFRRPAKQLEHSCTTAVYGESGTSDSRISGV